MFVRVGSPWAAAVATHTYLLIHPHLPPVDGPVPAADLEPEEWVVGVLDRAHCTGLSFARWANTAVVYHSPASVAVGSPQFVAGYLLGTLTLRAHTRRRARREATPRWWHTPLLCLVATTHRLWCLVAEPHRPPRWISITYAHVTTMNLTNNVLTASFRRRRTAPARRLVDTPLRGRRLRPAPPVITPTSTPPTRHTW